MGGRHARNASRDRATNRATSLHAHLHLPGHTVVHRLGAAPKIVGVVAFAIAVAVTPQRAWLVFGAEAAIAAGTVALARLPLRTALVRLAPVVPFLIVAALMPVVGRGARVDVDVGLFTLRLSREGLWAGGAVAAKTVLGATASVVLASTTPVPDIIGGLGRLRVPAALIAIVAFMLRYVDLLADQLRRMRTAMVARCHDPRWLWQARPIATSLGTLFVRTYERGERVHQAMLARGFTGTLPDGGRPLHQPPAREQVAPAALAGVPGLLAAAALVAWWLT